MVVGFRVSPVVWDNLAVLVSPVLLESQDRKADKVPREHVARQESAAHSDRAEFPETEETVAGQEPMDRMDHQVPELLCL